MPIFKIKVVRIRKKLEHVDKFLIKLFISINNFRVIFIYNNNSFVQVIKYFFESVFLLDLLINSIYKLIYLKLIKKWSNHCDYNRWYCLKNSSEWKFYCWVNSVFVCTHEHLQVKESKNKVAIFDIYKQLCNQH